MKSAGLLSAVYKINIAIFTTVIKKYIIDEDRLSAPFSETLQYVKSEPGNLSNFIRIRGLGPDTMRMHPELYLSSIFSDSGIIRVVKKMIPGLFRRATAAVTDLIIMHMQ